MARPVNLSVIDGIKNAVGGEGPWNPTFTPSEYDFLLAGKDPVATDSIATLIMGLDPEAEQLVLPTGLFTDNHLWLANQKGLGTNILEEIELVGDGAGAILGLDESGLFPGMNSSLRIYPNYPNPCRDYTSFKFYNSMDGNIKLEIYDMSGKIISTLQDGYLQKGEHIATWSVNGNKSGTYFCRLTGLEQAVTRRIAVQ
jgi:hypothetical protein